MFGVAGRSFTKTISNDLGIEYDAAEKLKLNIGDDKIKPTVRKVLDEAVAKTLDVWIGGVQLALGEFDAIDHLPTRILLCGGGSSLEALVSKLKEGSWTADLPFSRRPIVQHIHPDDVIGVTDTTGDVNNSTYITAMGLLRVGYDTMVGGSDVPASGVRGKLNKILGI
jgi:cell division protein FtsA